jgi:hypothetical protein
MAITRKDFCVGMAGGSVLLLLQSCGGGGDGAAAPAPAAACGAAAIAGNHGHVLTIARADLDALTDQTYSIAGSAGHDHTLTLTVAQLRQLKAGTNVAVTSSVTSALPQHDHLVTVACT